MAVTISLVGGEDGLGCSFGCNICHGCGVYNGCGCDTGSCVVSGDCARRDDCCNCSGVILSQSGNYQCHGCRSRSKDVEGELLCGEYVLAVDVNLNESIVKSDEDH